MLLTVSHVFIYEPSRWGMFEHRKFGEGSIGAASEASN
jgi:hypothetical protein